MQLQSIAVFGTASDVGKSVVATALCRILSDMGCGVAPFKAQNMSNNSGVAPGLGEMGRAQVVQAEAARVAPHPDMNPVLLKPTTDKGSQVVLNGRVMGHRSAREYFSDTSYLAGKSVEAMKRLQSRYPVLVIEGAGSCAEVNLRPRDYVNFRTAHALDCPVVLVADIDRGGVFAQVVGTLAVLPPEDRARVKGVIINRFRGDASLFEDGVTWLEQETGLPILGVIPYFRNIQVEWEDALPPDLKIDDRRPISDAKLNIAVIPWPHMSNFTDAAPLMREPQIDMRFLRRARDLHDFDLLLLPGSKNVRFDMEWAQNQGWFQKISEYAAGGGRVGGICGGFQILGEQVHDPHGVEGKAGSTRGLGLIPAETELQEEKQLCLSNGLHCGEQQPVNGYEIHMGHTTIKGQARPLIQLAARDHQSVSGVDGYLSENGAVWGTYFHGLFENAGFRNAFLSRLKPGFVGRFQEDEAVFKDRQYDLLADHFRANLDMEKLQQILQVPAAVSETR